MTLTMFLHLSLAKHNYFHCMGNSRSFLTKQFQGFGVCKIFMYLLMWRVVNEQDMIKFEGGRQCCIVLCSQDSEEELWLWVSCSAGWQRIGYLLTPKSSKRVATW